MTLPDVVVGLIGMGEMGRMYATHLGKAGVCLHVCDLPSRFEALQKEYKDATNVHVLRDGHLVARSSDLVIYSVEAEFIDQVVGQFGPSTKIGAIVAGQTSVKAPERAAFEKHLPQDVYILSLHSLHGPSVAPEGQPLVRFILCNILFVGTKAQILIQHRASDEQLELVKRILAPLKSRYVKMTYDEHDEITANTQAVTHAAFLSMGTAWHKSNRYPWETTRYIGGIETVKVNIALRIYSAKWHVYAGLAILNPAARIQIDQYARSVTDLFKLMLEERHDELRERILKAKAFVFGVGEDARRPIFVSDQVFNAFTVGRPAPNNDVASSNSHLSLLAMVDCWASLQIRPFLHLELAATPIFRLWFGVVEYLFRDESRLDAAIRAAAFDKTHRSDDLEFAVAARGWSQCVSFGSFPWYRHRFEETATFFAPRFDESSKVSAKMIKEVLADQAVRK